MSQVIAALLKQREKIKAKIDKIDQDTAAKRGPLAEELVRTSRALLELGHTDVPTTGGEVASGGDVAEAPVIKTLPWQHAEE